LSRQGRLEGRFTEGKDAQHKGIGVFPEKKLIGRTAKRGLSLVTAVSRVRKKFKIKERERKKNAAGEKRRKKAKTTKSACSAGQLEDLPPRLVKQNLGCGGRVATKKLQQRGVIVDGAKKRARGVNKLPRGKKGCRTVRRQKISSKWTGGTG